MLDGDIHLGVGVTLRSLERLKMQLGIPGLTNSDLKTICESLSVPCVMIKDTWFVNIFSLQIAFAMITRIGAHDFQLNGSQSLPNEEIAENLTTTIAHLIATRHSRLTDTHSSVINAGRDIARRVEAMGMRMLLKKQTDYSYEDESKKIFTAIVPTLESIERKLYETPRDPCARKTRCG